MPTVNESGKAFLKGDKYKVELVDQDIYCDGETITTHVKEDEECYTSSVEDSEEEMITPNKLLTIWEDGYKYKYIKETTFQGTPVHHINLFPIPFLISDRVNAMSLGVTNSRNGFSGFFFNSFLQSISDFILRT